MLLKSLCSGLLLAGFFSVSLASDSDVDAFAKKYEISAQELVKFERMYMDSVFGLKRLTGLRSQLKEYTDKDIDSQDLLQFAANFSKKIDSLAAAKITEFGGSFGLKQADFDKALDDSLDNVLGKNPEAFLEGIRNSLIKSASKKPSLEQAMSLAKAVQIRMDMTMMKNHLRNADYMNRLIGEDFEDLLKPPKGPTGTPRSVR